MRTTLFGISLLGIFPFGTGALAQLSEDNSQTGIISWYGRGFHGRKTANGERYNMHELTCASRKLPFGTQVEVTNLDNGQSVILRVNDRGPFYRSRILDVSFRAAKELGLLRSGYVRAVVKVLPENFELLRQEEQWVESSGMGERVFAELDRVAEQAFDTCLKGKPRKNPECKVLTVGLRDGY